MHADEIPRVAAEVATLSGRLVRSIFPLGRKTFAIGFEPSNGRYLYLDLDFRSPAIFLISRRHKTLAEAAAGHSELTRELQTSLTGSTLESVSFSPLKVRLNFMTSGLGAAALLVNLSRSDAEIDVRAPILELLTGPNSEPAADETPASPYDAGDLEVSERLDHALRLRQREAEFDELASRARSSIDREAAKIRKLIDNLHSDEVRHSDPEQHKRLGDLILANLSTLQSSGSIIRLTDYFDPDLATIELAIKPNQTPTQLAEQYFRRYTKARNAQTVIAERLAEASRRLERVQEKRERLQKLINARDVPGIEAFLGKPRTAMPVQRKKQEDQLKGVRRFRSSDGFEILVGKGSADNDHLTFRIAKSLDTWLHAADYPGSHVVIRMPRGAKVPDRTLAEAARLAAFYSQARKMPKAAVNYTERKYVRKPRKSAPGLVSLAAFRTLLVEPDFPESVERIDD